MLSASSTDIKGSLISYFSNLIKVHGGINLAQGIPGFNPPKDLIRALQNEINIGSHQYAPGTGNIKLVSYLSEKYEIEKNNARVLITNGATEAISLIYNYLMSFVVDKDFNVAAFSPAYEAYIHLPKIFGHKFFTYSIKDDVYFDDDEFSHFFVENKIKVLFIANPGNPFGKAMPRSKIEFLINLAVKNQSYIILDSVYNELYFGDDVILPSPSIKCPNVFYVNSFSKKFSITGWRIGYFVMHESHYEQMCYVHDYIGLCAPAPLQQALADFVETSAAAEYIYQTRAIISSNYKKAVEVLSQHGFYCPQCDGGYFVWCRLPQNFDNSLKFGLELYDKSKTAVIPGIHFGDEWNNYIRINIARPEIELLEGIENIVKMKF